MNSNTTKWPELPYDEWKDTLDTLHMWMQIVGKVKLELAPFVNQWWEVAFYVTANGVTSGPIPYGEETFQIDFDFITHTLFILTSTSITRTIPLKRCPVSVFYEQFIHALEELEIYVTIWPVPVEVENPIPFPQDLTHASYDEEYVKRWWHILVEVNEVLEEFRTSFRGKSSPIQFFWGSFDLNGTRFSGRRAIPPKTKGVMKKIMDFAENEENFAFGFWPGDERFPAPAFYTYIYPALKGYDEIKLSGGASFNEQLRECILSYEVVRKSKNPEKSILDFLEMTYMESASLAGWDIESLKTQVPKIHHRYETTNHSKFNL